MPIQFPQMYVAYKAIPVGENIFPDDVDWTLCFRCAITFANENRPYRIVPFASEHDRFYSDRCDRCNEYLDW